MTTVKRQKVSKNSKIVSSFLIPDRDSNGMQRQTASHYVVPVQSNIRNGYRSHSNNETHQIAISEVPKMSTNDPCQRTGTDSLSRFTEAQNWMYQTALNEIKAGKKRSHWMWYIFPQLRGLGNSVMSHKYAINGIEEARAYLEHPVLSARLKEISSELLKLDIKDPEQIFGYTDSIKLRASMTLFAYVSESGSVFHRVLEQYYNGHMDDLTLKMINT